MIILSQDGERLEDFIGIKYKFIGKDNQLPIGEMVDKEYHLIIDKDNDCWLGQYSTKERCIEVIEDIAQCQLYSYNKNCQMPYKMPKE